MGLKLTKLQFAPEPTAGTLVAATLKWPGEAEFVFDDKIELPPYAQGEAGWTLEDAFISSTGSALNLKDTECSAEVLLYVCQFGLKKIAGVAASTFAFTLPTTGANTIGSSTWEFGINGQVTQEYEFGYGFFPSFSVHGDAEANNGRLLINGVVKGRKAAASTETAALSLIPAHEPLNFNAATIKIDALGTAAGTAAATAGFLKAFSMDVETGWSPGGYADGRTTKDFSIPEGGGTSYKITGNMKCLLNSVGVTELANARAGTGRIVQVSVAGTSSRVVKFNLPLTFTEAPKLGGETANGLILATFPYQAGYSRTATAQGPNIDITLSAAVQVFA